MPSLFYENKKKWTKLLLKLPSIQEAFNDFTERLSLILEKELKYNRQLIESYLCHPRFTD